MLRFLETRGRDSSVVRCTAVRYVLTAMFLLAPTVVRTAAACTCDINATPPCAAVWRADAVFIGTVEEEAVEGIAGNLSWTVHRISVNQRLQGSVDSFITLTPSWRLTEQEIVESRNIQPGSTQMSTCDYRFKPGRQYLIYARRAPDGRWTTNWCAGTKPIEAAAADLDYIASIALLRPYGRIYGNVERTTVDPSSGLSPMPAPAAGVRVALTSGSKRRFIKTDSNGRIDAQVPPGDYTVAPVAPDNVLVSGSPARVFVPAKGCAAVQFSLSPKALSVRP
jgi:hypothetical protein